MMTKKMEARAKVKVKVEASLLVQNKIKIKRVGNKNQIG